MSRFKVDMTMWVDTRRGPDPKPDQVDEALKGLLGSDTMHISVDLPGGAFEAAELMVEAVESKVQVIE